MKRLKTMHNIAELSDEGLTRLKERLELELSSTRLVIHTLKEIETQRCQELQTVNRLLATPSSPAMTQHTSLDRYHVTPL